MRIQALLLLVILYGCGRASDSDDGEESGSYVTPPQGETEVPGESRHSMLVADAKALPACDAAGEGWLVYVRSEETFRVCASGTWEPIEIQGKPGPKGDKGDKGPKGDQGPGGMSILATWSYHAPQSSDPVPYDHINAKMWIQDVFVTIMTDHSAFVFVSGARYVDSKVESTGHSFFLPAATGPRDVQVAIAFAGHLRMTFEVADDGTPTIAFVSDFDGDPSNDPEAEEYELTKD